MKPPSKSRSSSKKSSGKQSSILSFFSASPGPAPTSSSFAQPSLSNRTPRSLPKKVRSVGSSSSTPKIKKTPAPESLQTPSTTVSTEERSFSTRSRTAQLKKQFKKSQEDDDLRKELFQDADDEEEPVRILRKRKKNLISHDSSDEEDGDGPVKTADRLTPSKIAHQFNMKPRDSPRETKKHSPLLSSAKRQRVDPDVYIPDDEELREADIEMASAETECTQPSQSCDEDLPMRVPDLSSESNDRFDFDSLRSKPGGSTNTASIPTALQQNRSQARKKFSEMDANSRAVGNEEGGWCEKHPWSTDIRDSKKRPKDHPEYDKTTLYVPPRVLNETRGPKYGGLSPFQRQFWSIKKDNYDIVIFFKKGKFYEMYDIDADIGHKELGLNYTKGGRVDMRCCGVPEQALEKHCARLIDMGYKVGRVEQTETANALEKRKNSTSSNKSSVCERALIRIMTRATVTEDAVLRDHNARYVLAVVEGEQDLAGDLSSSMEQRRVSDERETSVGVCYVDVASGKITLSQYKDDARLSKTDRLIMFLQPHELIVDLSVASPRLRNIVTWATRKIDGDLINVGPKGGFKPMKDYVLASYLKSSDSKADKGDIFDRVCEHMRKHSLSCKAFGATVAYLKSLIIDVETLSLGNYILLSDSSSNIQNTEHKGLRSNSMSSERRLRLDAATLQNLEVLSSSDNGVQGSLLAFVDRARTPAGRRLIRKWLAEPLVDTAHINDRLQAIEDIHNIEAMDGGRTLQSLLKQINTKKDLERALPQLHRQATVKSSAVMFDDTNKRLVKGFLSVIRGLHSSLGALDALQEALESCQAKSHRLKELCTLGAHVPEDALDKLNYFLGQAFDMDRAESDGEIVPKKGAIPSYDEARTCLNDVEDLLNAELRKWQKKLGDRSIKFYHRGKEPYQIEVKLDTLCGRIPNEFVVVSESKGSKRFYTRKVTQLVRDHVEASEAYEDASSSVARYMMLQFDQEYETWSTIVSACSEVDALIGLAYTSLDDGCGPMCRPKVLDNDYPKPTLKAIGLRHPILARESDSFVSNDVKLGDGGETDIMILTGPNAGGKSTLARQVALSAVLAQIGCFVPAQSYTVRPFEDIYVRMGASDDLARGRSTFMVEMEEVSNILNNATDSSLVIADEVGRGTSTHDGYAVAHASLEQIARVNKCLTIFSTHYSHLGEDIVSMSTEGGTLRAGLYEMAAELDEKRKSITFLYKVRKGSSGHSRGIYCARVAGLGEGIAEAAEKAAQSFGTSFMEGLARMEFVNTCRTLDKDASTMKRLLGQQ